MPDLCHFSGTSRVTLADRNHPTVCLFQDYLMALSLQQEQQSQDLTWEQVPEGISDLELAKKLQEEEDRRASQFYQEQEQAAQAQVWGGGPLLWGTGMGWGGPCVGLSNLILHRNNGAYSIFIPTGTTAASRG